VIYIIKQIKNSKKINYKKDGFTLIEVIAALAIISILSIMIIPKVGKYVEKSKETKALDDVRQVVLAVEDYSITSGSDIKDSENFMAIKNKISKLNKNSKGEFIDLDTIQTIDDSMTYKTMQELIDGKKNFTLQDGKIQVTK